MRRSFGQPHVNRSEYHPSVFRCFPIDLMYVLSIRAPDKSRKRVLRGRLYRTPAVLVRLGHGFTIALIASTTALALIGPAYSEVLYVLEPSESVLRRLV